MRDNGKAPREAGLNWGGDAGRLTPAPPFSAEQLQWLQEHLQELHQQAVRDAVEKVLRQMQETKWSVGPARFTSEH